MYLLVYTDNGAQALQSDNSVEIPNSYKIQLFSDASYKCNQCARTA
jgi:hypothetical protein